MAKKQRIESYRGNYISDIRNKIREDAERFEMLVKDVSLSCAVSYGSSYYYAIAIFEKED